MGTAPGAAGGPTPSSSSSTHGVTRWDGAGLVVMLVASLTLIMFGLVSAMT